MSDLELIDNLLIELRAAKKMTPQELVDDNLSVARQAVERLGEALGAGEVPHITLTWARVLGLAEGE